MISKQAPKNSKKQNAKKSINIGTKLIRVLPDALKIAKLIVDIYHFIEQNIL